MSESCVAPRVALRDNALSICALIVLSFVLPFVLLGARQPLSGCAPKCAPKCAQLLCSTLCYKRLGAPLTAPFGAPLTTTAYHTAPNPALAD